jgi:hypothetical protein
MNINELINNPLVKILLLLLIVLVAIKVVKAALSILWILLIVGAVAYIVSDDVRRTVNQFISRIFGR